MNASPKSLLRSLGVVLAVSFCTLTPTQAAVYSGSWDPLFGATPPALSTLFWAGEFSVQASCPTIGTGGIGDCGAVTVLKALLKLGTGLNTYSATHDFIPVQSGSGIGTVSALQYSSNTITQLQTGVSEWWSPVGGTWDNWEFALQFVMDGNGDPGFPGVPDVPSTYSGPVLFARILESNLIQNFRGLTSDYCEPIPSGYLYFRADVTNPDFAPSFTGLAAVVPEPGVVTLLAGALLALGWSRRSRRGQPTSASAEH